jgi:hypothetical protein
MAVDIYDVYYDFGDKPNPLERLRHRLHLLGKLLSLLCCLWIAVVGTVLVRDLTPDDLEHHRAPVMQERVKTCTGEFAQRFACTNTLLISGEHSGATALLARLGVTLILPVIALTMWRGVMRKAERLC